MAAQELNNTVVKNSPFLRAYYRLENGALTSDSGPNGYTLTNTNTVGEASGIFGGAADFSNSNTNKILVVNNDLGITGGSASISIWVKLNAEISSGIWCFASQDDATTGVLNHIEYDYNGGTRRVIFSRNKYGVAQQTTTYTITLGTSNWHHLVYTYNSTSVIGYVDGIATTPAAASGNGNPGSSDKFSIGARDYGSQDEFASGIIDDISVFSKALSADEVKELYEGRTVGELWPQPNLVGLWHLNQSGTDFSGSNYHLTNNGTTTFTTGKFGNSADLGSSNTTKYLNVASNLGIDGGSITILTWVKIQTEPAANQITLAVQCSASTDVIYEIMYGFYGGASRHLIFSRERSGIGASVLESSNFDLGTTNWHLIGLTYDGTNIKGYWNGKYLGSTAGSGNGSDATKIDAFVLGARRTAAVTATQFSSAFIDESAVFSRALSHQEILNYYSWSLGRYTKIL